MEYTKVGIPVGSFAALGSPLKVRLYRQNGATIEQVVTIEKGGVLLSGNIHIAQRKWIFTMLSAESLVLIMK